MNTFTSLVAVITIFVIIYITFIRKNDSKNLTECHPKTDNFDFWCLKEIGKGWDLRIFLKGCSDEEVKATCKKTK